MKRALPWLLLVIALVLGVQSYRKVIRLEQAMRRFHGPLPILEGSGWERWRTSARQSEKLGVSSSEESRSLIDAARTSQELEDLLEAGRFPEAQQLARALSRRLARWRPPQEEESTDPSRTRGLLKFLQGRVRRAPADSLQVGRGETRVDEEASP